MLAHSFEFVAKPSEIQRLQVNIPAALTGVLKDVTGFAGCLVMVGALEARLVTVVTLWAGLGSHRRCSENVRWIQTILAPYVDRSLRMQTHFAAVSSILTHQPEANAADERFLEQANGTHGEGLCVA